MRAFAAAVTLVATEQTGVVQVAVPLPLRRVFDYRYEGAPPVRGGRVKVPFGARTVIGVVVANRPPQPRRRLKFISEVLDTENLFGEKLLDLLIWAAHYYHHSLGEALQTALPVALRKGKPVTEPSRSHAIRARSPEPTHDREQSAQALLLRAPLQARIYHHLRGSGWVDAGAIRQHFPNSGAAVRRLREKGLVEVAVAVEEKAEMAARAAAASVFCPPTNPITLNPPQQHAADTIGDCTARFGSFLLHGITGSGKTAVYLEAAQRCIANGAQTLILVPEIALTPQLVATVKERLGDRVCVLHSALSAEKRYHAWRRARQGHAVAVLGTRSAVFTPLKNPGLIVVDEEHDISYKQQNGFRYHARDLAIKRASLENIPVVLGSATPAMETRHNAQQGRHQLLRLSDRPGGARLPRINFINLKQHRPFDGISMPLLRAIQQRLAQREQCLVFLNRRGFAPLAQCYHCGWQAGCARCDARLTYHRAGERFQCHHCGHASKAEMACAACGERILLLGAGTQRLQHFLKKKFPEARIRRLDRDQVTTQEKLERELEAIQRGKTDIIIGTQLLAKGHDFSKVTLVGIVDSDQRLFSVDFRAPEYLFQQLTQVSGRAGRATSPGEVLIQTAQPEHPTLQSIRRHDFDGFADHCLTERRAANYPPFSHLALWRAESTDKTAALKFLRHVAAVGNRKLADCRLQQVQIMDAVISPMEKLAGRYRAQLMVRSARRSALHQLLGGWVEAIENDPQARRARWSLDIDPMEIF